jgi:hypothetical protein
MLKARTDKKPHSASKKTTRKPADGKSKPASPKKHQAAAKRPEPTVAPVEEIVPLSRFDELSLSEPLQRGIAEMGFETPTDRWLRERYAGEARRRLLTPGPLHEWIDPSVMRAELEDFLSGRRAIGLQVWRWLSLESWARRFIAVDARVRTHSPDPGHNAGAHRSYVEVTEALEREVALGTA